MVLGSPQQAGYRVPVHQLVILVEGEFFRRDAVECARDLVGAELHVDGSGGVIVETEAYRASGDAACHTFLRTKARTFVVSYPAGTAYVYLNYGIHWMLNFLTAGPQGPGFVLIRALMPTRGIAAMEVRRKGQPLANLCAGPGKLTRALGIDGSLHGQDFLSLPDAGISLPEHRMGVIASRRIGISQARELPWRFLAEPLLPWVSAPPDRSEDC